MLECILLKAMIYESSDLIKCERELFVVLLLPLFPEKQVPIFLSPKPFYQHSNAIFPLSRTKTRT